MPFPIAAVMVHVPDVEAALRWYEAAFAGEAVRVRIGTPVFECLSVHGVLLEIVPGDEKVGSGASGSVVYWAVDDFDAALRRFEGAGAVLYRGPLRLDDPQGVQCMCQVRDPWGNCIGIRGPA
ncbi:MULTISPECIES: VOC family protein [unclassified Variovorax]|uniref:VOC family protein n=1 Tax=unclassified Variovorax TaxID=663243 RepID=UPI000F7E581D|nr:MULTISPECIES: VOC family protein [unclassified Variovorax]RSZ42330.1 glyoxalase/bleomycin resistance/dioxygenase family protein [Variovorax sp. 553]RSZ43306.1 glyoxalase/bleomycin resistance/dioxygenase family protein [Variovorax sp. 679]